MIKKIFISLGVVLVLSFVSCGGGSSKEAQEVLQKILTVIGIPQEVITNICQGSNGSDICEGLKLYTKVEKTDDKSKSWHKIKETGEGQYLLETTTPCEPILLELQDDDINDDNGEFMLKFSGVKVGVKEKELSILEAMIDATYLSASNVNAIKNLNGIETQNSFYAILYRNLKTNINTLRAKGLTKTQAVRGTLKEMAEELASYDIEKALPTRINDCNSSVECIESELSNLNIDENETGAIFETQKDNTSPLGVQEVSCEKQPTHFIINKGIVKDKTGEESNGRTIPAFIDFSEFKVDVTETNIIVEMTVLDLPNELVYNRNTMDNSDNQLNRGYTEYSWSISFSTENDERVGLGTSIYGGKEGAERVGVVSDIIKCNINEKYIDESGSPYNFVKIDGNTIILDVPKSLHKDLAKITTSTGVYFDAQHAYNNNPDDIYYDYY